MYHPLKGVCVCLLSAESRRTLRGDPSEPRPLKHHVPVQEEASEPPLPRHQPQRGGPGRLHSLCRVRVALALLPRVPLCLGWEGALGFILAWIPSSLAWGCFVYFLRVMSSHFRICILCRCVRAFFIYNFFCKGCLTTDQRCEGTRRGKGSEPLMQMNVRVIDLIEAGSPPRPPCEKDASDMRLGGCS